MTNYNNPWATRLVEMETRFFGGNRRLAVNAVAEATEAEAQPTQVCTCGATSYYSPTSALWKCPQCGRLTDCHGDPY